MPYHVDRPHLRLTATSLAPLRLIWQWDKASCRRHRLASSQELHHRHVVILALYCMIACCARRTRRLLTWYSGKVNGATFTRPNSTITTQSRDISIPARTQATRLFILSWATLRYCRYIAVLQHGLRVYSSWSPTATMVALGRSNNPTNSRRGAQDTHGHQ